MKFDSKILVFVCKALSLFLLAGALLACQSTRFTYQGATANPEISLPLKADGSHDGTLSTYDLNIYYRYQRHADTLNISGNVELIHHSSARDFLLRLHFLDNDHIILDTKHVMNAGYRKSAERTHFTGQFQLPPATAAIAFSYYGKSRDGSETGSSTFWMDPRRADRSGRFF